MDGAGDIVGISFPFAAGVASAAFLPEAAPGFSLWAALASSVCLSILLICCCRKDAGPLTAGLMYFVLGAFCFLSASLTGPAPKLRPGFAENALQKFSALIEGAGFENDSTGSLVKALLTGRRDAIDRETAENFRAAGAAHILALSGLHLGVIYGILSRVLAVLGHSRPAAAIRSVTVIAASGFYTIMTGASPSIVRAFLFISLNEAARLQSGRRRPPANVYCTALTVQLALNPLAIQETGFQLSYLAMLGIILLFPRMDSWYPSGGRFDPFRRIWSSAALTISCQVFTAPLVWMRFHSFPVHFLLTNLIALPLTELLIISALLTLALCATGLDPHITKSLTELFGQTLVYCLDVISGMQPPS